MCLNNHGLHCRSVVLVCFCTGMAARMPMMNGLIEPKPFSQSQMGPGAGPDMARNIPPMQRMPFPDNLRSAINTFASVISTL